MIWDGAGVNRSGLSARDCRDQAGIRRGRDMVFNPKKRSDKCTEGAS